MKKFIFIYLVFTALLIQSCNKIDEPYTTPVAAKNWYGRKILLEDYSGHACVNCPRAANVAKILEKSYGEEIVVMTVHVGFFAEPSVSDGLPEDFRTAAGNAWGSKFNIGSNLPQGMINRVGYPSSHIIPDAAWASKISDVIMQLPYVSIEFENNNYTTIDSTLRGNLKIKMLKLNNYKLNVQICITEDSIIAPQKNSTSTGDPNQPAFIPYYVHNHLLRGAVNGSWGEQITQGLNYNLVGTEIVKPYIYTFPKTNWNVKNCHLIAFVYDAITYEVLQVEEIKIQ